MIFLVSSDKSINGPLGVHAVLAKTSRGSQEAVNPESASDKELLPTPPETYSLAVTCRMPVYANCKSRFLRY
jgi:hypothetical protein